MGGANFSSMDDVVQARIDKAVSVTSKQIDAAKKLYSVQFAGETNPAVLAAIIQAVATNYATVVSVSER